MLPETAMHEINVRHHDVAADVAVQQLAVAENVVALLSVRLVVAGSRESDVSRRLPMIAFSSFIGTTSC